MRHGIGAGGYWWLGTASIAACAVLLAGTHPGKGDAQSESLSTLANTHGYALRVKHFGGGPKFAPSVSEQLWGRLHAKARDCSQTLFSAQQRAAREGALRANQSFRNCSIKASRKYLRSSLWNFEERVKGREFVRATTALGRTLATLHAFYAFTNYVELRAAKNESLVSSLRSRVNVWGLGALDVPREQLRSDYSASAAPNGCGDLKPDHDKRTARGAGAVVLKPWYTPAHEAAVAFALADTEDLLDSLAKKHTSYFEGKCASSLIYMFLPARLWD